MVGYLAMEKVCVCNIFPFSFSLITFFLHKVLCLNHSKNFIYNAEILDLLLLPCECWAFPSVFGIFLNIFGDKSFWREVHSHNGQIMSHKSQTMTLQQWTKVQVFWIIEILFGLSFWRPPSPPSCLKQDYAWYYNRVISSRITLPSSL